MRDTRKTIGHICTQSCLSKLQTSSLYLSPFGVVQTPIDPFLSPTMVNPSKTVGTSDAWNDGRSKSRVANYTGFWEKNAAHDGEDHKNNRVDNYNDVVNGLSHLLDYDTH